MKTMGKFFLSIILLNIFFFSSSYCNAQETYNERPVSLVILLDRSGSMKNTDPEGLSIAAASFIIDQLSLTNERNRVAVVPFSTEAYILGQDKTHPETALTNATAALIEMLVAGITDGVFHFKEVNPENPRLFHELLRKQMRDQGYTELGKALDLADSILSNAPDESVKMILLISDGIPEPLLEKKRLREIGIFDNSLIQRVLKKRLKSDIDRLNTIYGEHILSTKIPEIASKGIGIYPVAFHRKDEESKALVDYLKKIKRLTTGDDEIISVDTDNLIEKLAGFIPSGVHHIRLRNLKSFIKPPSSIKRFNLKVPDISMQTRFIFSYKNTRPSHNPVVKIYRNNELIADSTSPERYGDVIFSTLHKRDGSIVYQSIRIANPDEAGGAFKIEVEDKSRGRLEGLPETDIFVDMRANIFAEVEFSPTRLTAKAPIEMRYKLFARKNGKDRVLNIVRADIFIIGQAPVELKGLSYRVREIKYIKSVAIARLREGIPHPGRYLIKARLFFEYKEKTQQPPQIYFNYPFEVASALPLEGNVWIARRESKTAREKDLKVVLPPIGEEFKVSYKKLEVRTSLNQIIDNLKLNLLPFKHEEIGIELGSTLQSWADVEPDIIRGLSTSKYIPLRIEIKVPSTILPDIPDGTYHSQLQILDGVKVIDSVPLSLMVFVPRFVADKTEADKRFNPSEGFSRILVKKTILYPGDTEHLIKIKLWSTSLKGVEAKGYFMDNRALIYKGEDEEPDERSPHVIFNVAGESFPIPGKNAGKPGVVRVNVKLLDPSLNGKDFINTLYVTGKQHREVPVKIKVLIRFVPAIYIRLGALFIMAIALFVFYRWYRLRSQRMFFEGFTKENNITEGEPSEYPITFRKRTLGRFMYNGKNVITSAFGTTENVISFESDDGSYTRDGVTNEISGSFYPQEGDEINLLRGKKRITIRVNQLPTPVDLRYSFTVERSPLGKGNIRFLYFISGLVFSLFAVINLIDPYWLLRIFKV